MNTGLQLSGFASPFIPGPSGTRAGAPTQRYWKEMLPPKARFEGRLRPDGTRPIEVIDRARNERLAESYKRYREKGFEAPLPLGAHLTKDNAPAIQNSGWLVDVKVAEDGSLHGLHEFIGDEESVKSLVASMKSSIGTAYNVKDETGEVYPELIIENAILPNPRLNNLSGFVPALAASRGPAIEWLELNLAARETESKMKPEVKKRYADTLKSAGLQCSDGKDWAEDSDDDALQLSMLDLNARLNTAGKVAHEKAIEASALAESRGLELSRFVEPELPSADKLHYRAEILKMKEAQAVASGVTPAVISKARAKYIPAIKDADLAGLSLSREPAEGDSALALGLERMIDFCELIVHDKPGRGDTTKQGSGLLLGAPVYESLDPNNPNPADNQKIADDARAAGEAWKAEQLKSRGLAN